jgi:hypothetical protein
MEEPTPLLTLKPTDRHPRFGEGSVVPLKDGRLFVCYTRFERGARDNSPADICSRTSKDGGKTWSRTRVLVSRDEAKENVMSASVLRLKNGDLLLLTLRKHGWGDCNAYVRRSTDEFETLGGPVNVTGTKGYHIVNNDRLVQLSTGRLVAPASLHTKKGGQGREGWTPYGRMRAFISDDDGKTWRLGGEVPKPGKKVMLQEPGVVELKDGRLWMWMRTDAGCQYQSFSKDGGLSWSAPEPSNIKSPRSPAQIKRVPWTGDLMIVWNDHSGDHPYPRNAAEGHKNRTPLCGAISADDGKTWRRSRVIAHRDGGNFAYPSITFLKDRVIVGHWDCVVRKEMRIALRIVALPRTWLCGSGAQQVIIDSSRAER